MSILKWKNFDELLSIKDEIDRLFASMFETTSFRSWEERYALISSGAVSPQFEISHHGEDIVIRAEMPGYEKGDVKVSVSGNLLAIGSEISREREFRGENAYGYHRSGGSFCKVMELPAGVDTTRIRSSFKNGVLEVIIPRAVHSLPDRPGTLQITGTEPSSLLPDQTRVKG